MGFNWYVVQTKSRQTERARDELENQQFETYCPLIQVEHIRAGKRTVKAEPLFPGYLFIYLSEIDSNWRPIRSTRGVSRLLTFGDTPAKVPNDAIDLIKQQIKAQETSSHFTPDQPVEITAGPFRGLQAVFQQYDGEQRAFLLLNLLGKWQRLSLPLSEVH